MKSLTILAATALAAYTVYKIDRMAYPVQQLSFGNWSCLDATTEPSDYGSTNTVVCTEWKRGK